VPRPDVYRTHGSVSPWRVARFWQTAAIMANPSNAAKPADRPNPPAGETDAGAGALLYTAEDVEVARTRLRDIAGRFPEVSERLSHGATTFFVRGKRVLCYLSDDHHGDGRLAVICAAPPGAQEELTSAEPDRFYRPPYVGHRGWIGLRVDVAPDWGEVAALIEEAYRLVAPATLVRQLDETAPG
jgi:hypothetical protein